MYANYSTYARVSRVDKPLGFISVSFTLNEVAQINSKDDPSYSASSRQ